MYPIREMSPRWRYRATRREREKKKGLISLNVHKRCPEWTVTWYVFDIKKKYKYIWRNRLTYYPLVKGIDKVLTLVSMYTTLKNNLCEPRLDWNAPRVAIVLTPIHLLLDVRISLGRTYGHVWINISER